MDVDEHVEMVDAHSRGEWRGDGGGNAAKMAHSSEPKSNTNAQNPRLFGYLSEAVLPGLSIDHRRNHDTSRRSRSGSLLLRSLRRWMALQLMT